MLASQSIKKFKFLDRIRSGEQRQKIVAETGISKRTLERVVANEAKIRESTTDIHTSRKRLNRERMMMWKTFLASGSQIVDNRYFG